MKVAEQQPVPSINGHRSVKHVLAQANPDRVRLVRSFITEDQENAVSERLRR